MPLGARPPGRARTRSLGARAAARLSSQASGPAHTPAAANLLRRAVTLLPSESRHRLARLPDLAEVMMAIGEFAWAETFPRGNRDCREHGEDGLGAPASGCGCAVIPRIPRTGPSRSSSRAYCSRPRGRRESGGAGAGAAHAGLGPRNGIAATEGRPRLRNGDLDHASLGEDERQRQHAASQYAIAALYGPTPVTEAIEHCEAIVAEAARGPRTQGLVMSLLSGLRAMQGTPPPHAISTRGPASCWRSSDAASSRPPPRSSRAGSTARRRSGSRRA